jgi:hypothetical protein
MPVFQHLPKIGVSNHSSSYDHDMFILGHYCDFNYHYIEIRFPLGEGTLSKREIAFHFREGYQSKPPR